MTLQDLLALPPGELNKRAAEAMGWKRGKDLVGEFYDGFDGDRPIAVNAWDPETDYNDAALMRRECGELGLEDDFGIRLCDVLEHGQPDDHCITIYMISNATPRQITATAVWVMMGDGVKSQI